MPQCPNSPTGRGWHVRIDLTPGYFFSGGFLNFRGFLVFVFTTGILAVTSRSQQRRSSAAKRSDLRSAENERADDVREMRAFVPGTGVYGVPVLPPAVEARAMTALEGVGLGILIGAAIAVAVFVWLERGVGPRW